MQTDQNTRNDSYKYTDIDSPVGKLKLIAKGNRLTAILWENDDAKTVRFGPMTRDDAFPVLLDTACQLEEYFSGKRRTFDLNLDFAGTDFQKRVWNALLQIPYGETRTYGQLAEQLGDPKACRAVGAANGQNPISIVAPCHRVIGSSGKLTGFAGGLETKARLLALESGGTQARVS